MEKKPYARIDFINMNLDYESTICPLSDINDNVELFKNDVEDLDEIGYNTWKERDCIPEIQITVIFLTDDEFTQWFIDNVESKA
jgi:hypothetical protein